MSVLDPPRISLATQQTRLSLEIVWPVCFELELEFELTRMTTSLHLCMFMERVELRMKIRVNWVTIPSHGRAMTGRTPVFFCTCVWVNDRVNASGLFMYNWVSDRLNEWVRFDVVTYPFWLSIITNSELMSKYLDDGPSLDLTTTRSSECLFCNSHSYKCVQTNRLTYRRFITLLTSPGDTRLQLDLALTGAFLPACVGCVDHEMKGNPNSITLSYPMLPIFFALCAAAVWKWWWQVWCLCLRKSVNTSHYRGMF